MIKSFRDGVVSTFHMPDPDAVRAGLRILSRTLLLGALAYVLSRAVFVSVALACGLAPFAMSVFAAAMSLGFNPAGMLAGCVLGGINGSLETFNLALPIGCAVTLAGTLGWSVAAPGIGKLRTAMRRAPSNQARSPNSSESALELCMVLAGLSTLIPGLIYANAELWPSIQVTAAALAALAAAPFFREALRTGQKWLRQIELEWNGDRRHRASWGVMPEARIGLILLGLAAEAGICAIYLPGALALGSLAATLYYADGALVGLGVGASVLVMTGDARAAAALSLCGASAQLCGRTKDGMRVGCAVAAGLVTGIYLKLYLPALVGLCAGPPMALMLPRGLRTSVLGNLRRSQEGCDPERLAMLLRSDAAERLKAMSAAFGDLAESYLTPVSMPDEQALINRLRGALCEDCADYEACWAGETNRGARLLCDLVAMAVEDDDNGVLFEEGVPAEIIRQCRRGRMLPERIGELLQDFASARRAELKRGGENRLISAQFLQARQLIDALATEQARPVRLRDKQAKRAREALNRANMDVADALSITGQRSELILTLREDVWTERMARLAARRLCDAFGRVYVPAGIWGRTMRLARLPKLRAVVSAGSVAREAGAPSGDCHLTTMLDDERLLVLICDGMGCGEMARRESAQAVRLLGRFLAAGAEWSLAVETVNAMLLNVSAEDMFSTVDMLILNLSTGLAECMKLAACPTLIARDGALQRIEGGRLPLGILERVQPAASRVLLMPGDTLLMASDGVMDAVDPEALEALLQVPGDDMNALSEKVLALAQDAGVHRDDMTAVCLQLITAQPEAEL